MKTPKYQIGDTVWTIIFIVVATAIAMWFAFYCGLYWFSPAGDTPSICFM